MKWKRRGALRSFEMEKEGRSDVVSFLPHGKAFAIHDEEAFVQDVMPRYFANCQLPSFQKQLNGGIIAAVVFRKASPSSSMGCEMFIL